MPLMLADFLGDVAAVYIGAATEGAFGSGRLIAPGLVLTAGHVVDYPKREAPARAGWKIRLLRDRMKDGGWTTPPHEAELL
jgi:V8-like Glu-specific endopeptidase